MKKRGRERIAKPSQYRLAIEEAWGRRPDWVRVLHRLRVAHRAGDPRATYALATWYEYGKNVEKDLPRAYRMYADAARRGCLDSQFLMGFWYEVGEMGPRAKAKRLRAAAGYYMRAAGAGHQSAAKRLARCYSRGMGVAKDPRAARLWRGMSKSMDDLDEHCNNRPITKGWPGPTKANAKRARAMRSFPLRALRE